jgi:hypothetical protein
MCVCMYIYIYIYAYLYVYLCIYLCIYIYKCKYIFIGIHSPNGHIHVDYDDGNNGSTKAYTSNMYSPNRQIHTYSDECNDER